MDCAYELDPFDVATRNLTGKGQAMTDPHQEAIERVEKFNGEQPINDLYFASAAYHFAEQAVTAERKLEEAMRLLLWIEKWVRTGSPGNWCIADWNKEADAFLRENGGNK